MTRRNIVIDRDYRNNWLVTSGLDAGELLLVDGLQKVRSGTVAFGRPAETGTERGAFAETAPRKEETPVARERRG